MDALNNRVKSDDNLDNELDLHPDNFCMICLDSFTNSNTIELGCKHKFHINCILKSINIIQAQENKTNKKCPYCRTPFVYLPYDGGLFIKGIHTPNAVNEHLQKMNISVIQNSNIIWNKLKPMIDKVLVSSGKYSNWIGTIVKLTPTMVVLNSTNTENIIQFRTKKTNVLLLLEPNSSNNYTNIQKKSDLSKKQSETESTLMI